jgi:hypothetical protein
MNLMKGAIVLKDKKKVLIVVLLVVSSFMSGIFFSNYMTELEYQRLLVEIEELETEEGLITTHTPISCNSSTTRDENFGCENLYDLTVEGWEDDNQNCIDQWLEFDFGKEVQIEFMVFENYQYPGLFAQKDKIKDFEIVFDNGTVLNEYLNNSTDFLWIDTPQSEKTRYVRINILSSHNTLGVEQCHLQEISFYGYEVSNG